MAIPSLGYDYYSKINKKTISCNNRLMYDFVSHSIDRNCCHRHHRRWCGSRSSPYLKNSIPTSVAVVSVYTLGSHYIEYYDPKLLLTLLLIDTLIGLMLIMPMSLIRVVLSALNSKMMVCRSKNVHVLHVLERKRRIGTPCCTYHVQYF